MTLTVKAATNQSDLKRASRHGEAAILKAAVDDMAQGLVVYDELSKFVLNSATYRAIYRLDSRDLKEGMPLREVVELQAKSLGLSESEKADFRQPFSDSTIKSWTTVRKLPDGRSIQMHRRQMANGYFVVTHEDITDRVRMEEKIRFDATHDSLTELANRPAFIQALNLAMERARRGESVALMAIDLDGFKQVNDSYGHAIGDRVLELAAKRMKKTVRGSDTVARLGGDEFALIQASPGQPRSAGNLAARIIKSVSTPYNVDGITVHIGASIGITLLNRDVINTDALMHNADLALYKAKRDGRGCFHFFEEKVDEAVRMPTPVPETNLKMAT